MSLKKTQFYHKHKHTNTYFRVITYFSLIKINLDYIFLFIDEIDCEIVKMNDVKDNTT